MANSRNNNKKASLKKKWKCFVVLLAVAIFINFLLIVGIGVALSLYLVRIELKVSINSEQVQMISDSTELPGMCICTLLLALFQYFCRVSIFTCSFKTVTDVLCQTWYANSQGFLSLGIPSFATYAFHLNSACHKSPMHTRSSCLWDKIIWGESYNCS